MLLLLAALVFGVVISPADASGQSLEWTAGPALLIDTDFVDGSEVGPGLVLDLLKHPRRRLSYFASVSGGRTNFSVANDELHRNVGAAALGLRLSTGGPTQVGALLGTGALVWDDVSETDPNFRSGASGGEMLLTGVEVSFPVGRSLRARFSIRDQVTVVWNAILDSTESSVTHRIILALGVAVS